MKTEIRERLYGPSKKNTRRRRAVCVSKNSSMRGISKNNEDEFYVGFEEQSSMPKFIKKNSDMQPDV